MRYYIFGCGAAILALGGWSLSILDKNHALGFVQGALTLGGGMLICGIFSLKMRWHGIIGAGVLALLGAARGFGNLPALARFLTGERPRGVAPLLEFGVTLTCLLLLVKVLRALYQKRLRRMLEEPEE